MIIKRIKLSISAALLAAFVWTGTLQLSMAADISMDHIADVEQLVTHAMTAGKLQPSEILVIFDVHGTLTSKRVPDQNPVIARGKAVPLVQRLHQQGVNLVASSAWNEFRAPHDLGQLGLDEPFGCGKESTSGASTFKTHDGKEVKVNGYSNGNAVSIQDPQVDPRYFRQKALAPYFVLGQEKMNRIKQVILVDDSAVNIDYFKIDVQRFGLYPNVAIDYVTLSDPDRDPAGDLSHHKGQSSKPNETPRE